jgi:hypothetical protein
MPFDPAQGIPSEVEGCRPEGLRGESPPDDFFTDY